MESKEVYIAHLEQENASLKKLVESLIQRITSLEKEVARLSVKKNSQNSSMPPSTDISRKNQSLREKSDKPVGGQQGHEGNTLLMSSTPDIIVELNPDYCNQCGSDLREVEAIAMGRRQVVDIPPIAAQYTEYRQYKKQCPCCHHQQKSDYPSGVTNHIQYGKNVSALAVYNWVYQYLPFERLSRMLGDIFHLPISKATIENMILRCANGKGTVAYEQIQQRIRESSCVGSDETGINVGGLSNWAWVWQTKKLTWISHSVSRGNATVEQLFTEGLPKSILVSDRWKAQLNTDALSHQLCIAHLLRELNYIIEAEAGSNWAMQIKTLLQQTLQHKKQYAQSLRNNSTCADFENRLNELLNQSIEKQDYPVSFKLQKSFSRYREYIFTFLYHQEVPPDNNGSERAVRPIKVKQKISGQFKSLAQSFCVLRSIVDTAIKNGLNPLQAVMAIV